MAIADPTTVSRLGQVNGTGSDDALFLKQFGGEILTEFKMNTVFKERHFVRQIRKGKSAQFPMLGLATASMHTPGQFIEGQVINQAEKVITVDGLMVAPTFIADIDELMNHYDLRGPYAAELGEALARQYDSQIARKAVLAARATSPLTGRAGGSRITNASMATTGSVLKAAMFTAAQTYDEKNVTGKRTAFVRPAQYFLMAQETDLINKNYQGAGSIASGTLETVAGIDLVKSNNIPSTNVTTGTAAYQGDFRTTVAVITTPYAVGTVQLQDISVQSDWETRRQGTFFVARMAVGMDVLRCECAIELATGAVA